MVNTAIKLFKVKKITISNKMEVENKKLITYLVDGSGYIEKDGNQVAFEKVEIFFSKVSEQDVFKVCVDEILWINSSMKLIDNESEAAIFGKDAKDSKGGLRKYNHIMDRAMMVASAVSQGKVKLSQDIQKEDN